MKTLISAEIALSSIFFTEVISSGMHREKDQPYLLKIFRVSI